MRLRYALLVASSLLVAVLVQTTLFGQFRFFTPDLVMLVVIMLAWTRLQPEAMLGVAFLSGLVVDLLGSSLLGLRAVVFTLVGYLALRTRERAELGRLAAALWTGVITFTGVVLLVLIGTLFGQTSLLSEGVTTRVFVVPAANLVLAAVIAPWFVRMIDRETGSLRLTG